MLNYEQLNTLAQQITRINVWWKAKDVIDWRPVRKDLEGWASVSRSEVGVTLYVMASIGGGWASQWLLDFDPEHMPETEQDFWDYLKSRVFMRSDSPENTCPPPSSACAGYVNVGTTLRLNWVLARNPWLTEFT